jgi:hypothetical protein
MSHLHFCLTRSYCASLEKLPTDEAREGKLPLEERGDANLHLLSSQRHSSPPQGGRGQVSESAEEGASVAGAGRKGGAPPPQGRREPADEAVPHLWLLQRPVEEEPG